MESSNSEKLTAEQVKKIEGQWTFVEEVGEKAQTATAPERGDQEVQPTDPVKLLAYVREKRMTTPKSELKCVNCHRHPTVFHNDLAKKEFEEISQLCGACWEVVTLEPDADEDAERAKEILGMQNRVFIDKPRGWKCLDCGTIMRHYFGRDICKCK